MEHPLQINVYKETCVNVSGLSCAQKDTLEAHSGSPFLFTGANSTILDVEELRNLIDDDEENTELKTLMATLDQWGIPELDTAAFIHFL